jgi:hypothetical protein
MNQILRPEAEKQVLRRFAPQDDNLLLDDNSLSTVASFQM